MDDKFDGCLELLDWRYSAAIVGLFRYLEYYELPCNRDEIMSEEADCLWYNKADITEERYLFFAESYYKEDFPHKKAEKMLRMKTFTEDNIKKINELIVYNTVLKKIFGKFKFDGTNQQEILDMFSLHHLKIIRETFKNKKNMYFNYCNPNQLFAENSKVCRLNGYNIDWGKKGKSTCYCFDSSTYVGHDIKEFDFIPFAFSQYRDGIFINYNATIHDLIRTNMELNHAVAVKRVECEEENKHFSVSQVLFEEIIRSVNFLKYDVELIEKKREQNFFSTIYMRKRSIGIFRCLKSCQIFCFSYKVKDNYYIHILEKVMNSIINLTYLDDLIEFFLKEQEKEKKNFKVLLLNLIKVNNLIYGGEKMNRMESDMTGYQKREQKKEIETCATIIAAKLPENKLVTYRTKLTSALVFKDYNRVCEILLQLSNFANVSIACLLNVMQDCESNKNSVYLFITCLRKQSRENNNDGGKEV